MQSNGGRAMVALMAIIVLVGGFILLTGNDDAGEGSGDVANSTSTSATTTEETTTDESNGRPAEEPESDVPTIVVEGGQPVDGVAELEFNAGDEIEFAVESDAADEVHVHGYDIEQELEAGETTEFAFPADLDGIFEVELHESETQIAELTVNP